MNFSYMLWPVQETQSTITHSVFWFGLQPAALRPFVMVGQGAAGTVQLWFEVVGRVQRVLFWQGWSWLVPVGIKFA